MKTKKVRPVLVEIKDASNIFENNDKTLSFYEHKQHASSGGKKFELILISLEDEKIEEGDWKYNPKLNEIWQHNRKNKGLSEELQNTISNETVKVIARQSQIPPEYISKFIERYNNGCVEDLEIVMEYLLGNKEDENQNLIPELFPKLTNGSVTIVERETCDKCKNTCKKISTITGEFGSCTEFEKEPITYTEEVKSLCSDAYSLGLSSLKSEIPDLEEMM